MLFVAAVLWVMPGCGSADSAGVAGDDADSSATDSGTSDEAVKYLESGAEKAAAGELDAAIADYDRALEIEPNYVQALLNRGIAFHDLARYDDAIADADRALQVDPSSAFAHNNKGNSQTALGLHDEAIVSLTEAIN
jgi:tetratricopeptide (TPR) repeat protein